MEATAAAFFSAFFVVVSVTSVARQSATFDETAHIGAGYTYARFGDFHLNPEHPPLAKWLAGITLLPLKPHLDDSWRMLDEWQFGSKFLFEWNDADRLLFWGRVPILLLATLLGLSIWWVARGLYGRLAGAVALVLYVSNPDFLAHGQLVTTDLAVAFFVFLSVYLYYRALRRLTLWSVVAVCLAVGLALASKLTALLVFPMLVLVGVTCSLSSSTMFAGNHHVITRARRLLTAAGLIGVVTVSAFAFLWLCYGFRCRIAQPSDSISWIDWSYFWSKGGTINQFMRAIHPLHMLPAGYEFSVLFTNDTLTRASFLHGQHSSSGWWYYFLVTFLVKSTIPFILLLFLAVVLIRRYGAGFTAEAVLLLPVIFYWLVAVSSGLNIGHRHLLPVYPFLIVFTSKVARAFVCRRSRALALVASLLIAWNVIEAALVYPHFLSYFNEIAGGPGGGYKWLVDSNLDWGQDLKGLAEYRRQHPDTPFYLSYFGTASPAYYKIDAVPITSSEGDGVTPDEIAKGSLVAVSATNLQCAYITDRELEEFMRRLRGLMPEARVGYSIFIYRLP